MLRVGLTGGIGSGKTTVAAIFMVLGIPVYFADQETRRLMNEDEEMKANILRNFGEESYNAAGLNRTYIANLVFNSREKLELLNSITHPATIRHASDWMSRQRAPYVIKEAALIFESGSADNLDYIIGVSSPLELRIKRVMARDKITREEVMKRINRQMDEPIKMKLCDAVIINNEIEMITPQVLALHGKLVAGLKV